jgi:hypothetical protein
MEKIQLRIIPPLYFCGEGARGRGKILGEGLGER